MIKIKGKGKCSVKIIRIGRQLQSAKSMRQDSVRSAVSILTSTTAVSALIQNSTASSEPNVSSGKCRGTAGREKSRCPELRRVQGYPAPDVVWGEEMG
jgi:hypothetical protein